MRRKFSIFAVVLLLAPLVSSLLIQTLTAPKAAAATGSSFAFVDRSVIVGKDSSGTIVARYYDDNVDTDNTYKFKDDNGCVNIITNENSDGNPSNPGDDYLWANPYDAHEGGCMFDFKMDMTSDEVYSTVCSRLSSTPQSCSNETARSLAASKAGNSGKITVADRQNANINYYLIDDTYIYRSDSRETYQRDGTTDKFYRTNDPDNCDDVITINASHSPSASTPGATLQRMEEQGNGSCAKKGDPEKVYFGDITQRKSDGPDGLPQTKAAAKDGAQGGGTTKDNSCEAQGGALAWILCPVVKMIDSALDWVDTQIQALLEVDQSAYSDASLENAWAQIRNIAFIILIPIMLVMVISTALGFGFVDAYTIKRAMPKLIIAILFITLSWVITTFFIQMSNVIGGGVMGILTSPFKTTSKVGPIDTLTLSQLYQPLLGSGATGILAGIAGGAAFSVGVIVMLWMFGGTLLIFAAVAFLVLLMRQLLIVALVLVAPLAILAWIFPNTDRWWKTWSNMFIKLLIMFPMIMGLLALGHIFAYLIFTGGIGESGAQSIISQVAILIVWVLPYAFIPFTFRFAGGIFATLSGGIQNISKPLQESQKKSRQEKIQRTAQGNMFKTASTSGLRHRVNVIGAGVLNANKAGFRPTRWKTNLQTAAGASINQEIDKNLQENADYATWKGNDTLNRAAAASRNGDDVRHNLETMRDANGNLYANGDKAAIDQAVSQVERVRKQMSAPAFKQMTTLQALAGGTAFEDTGDAWAAVAAAGGNDESATAALVNKGRSALMNAGRVDQGGGSFGATLGEVRRMQDEMRKTGRAPDVTSRNKARDAIEGSALESSAPGQALYGKPKSAKHLAEAHVRKIDKIMTGISEGTHTERDLKQAMASAAGIYDAMGSASPQNAREFANGLMSGSINPANLSQQTISNMAPGPNWPTGNITMLDAMEGLRNTDVEFAQMRRDIGAQATAQGRLATTMGANALPPSGTNINPQAGA